jgi:predicted nucleotidyltransferase
MDIPADFRSDLERAVVTLKACGSTGIYLFGSLAGGNCREDSDIDLAVTGIPAARFFESYSLAARGLRHQLDLVDLDHETAFADFLREDGRLVRID